MPSRIDSGPASDVWHTRKVPSGAAGKMKGVAVRHLIRDTAKGYEDQFSSVLGKKKTRAREGALFFLPHAD